MQEEKEKERQELEHGEQGAGLRKHRCGEAGDARGQRACGGGGASAAVAAFVVKSDDDGRGGMNTEMRTEGGRVKWRGVAWRGVWRDSVELQCAVARQGSVVEEIIG